MTVSIPNELRQFIEGEVACGKYRSEEEVVAEAIALLRERERKRDAIRKDIQVGLDELDRGDRKTMDIEDVKARGRQRLSERGNDD